MSYVLNNRIPNFPLRPGYAEEGRLRAALGEAFQAWLREAVISNLDRRKACSQIYDFAVHADHAGRTVEQWRSGDFSAWCREQGTEPATGLAGFLAYARLRVPELDWAGGPGGTGKGTEAE